MPSRTAESEHMRLRFSSENTGLREGLGQQHGFRGFLLKSLLAVVLCAEAAQAQFTYVTNYGAITITGYTGSTNPVLIPATISGLPVTSIGSSAFANKFAITNVTIADSVTN